MFDAISFLLCLSMDYSNSYWILPKQSNTICLSFSERCKETQEMLHFCFKHNITADIETIQMQDVNEAFERLERGHVKYRFVIDMISLNN